jgi:hypothetical protein
MDETYYVDGYNVLHTSSKLRPLALRDFEAAREALLERLALFCAVTGKKVIIVFDGRGGNHPQRVEHHLGVESIEVVYAPTDISADSVIERYVYKTSHRLSLVVVSNDRGLRDLCRNMGAMTMEADSFLATMRESHDDARTTLAKTQHDRSPAHLDERIDPTGLARLSSLRDELAQQEKKARSKP